MPAECHLDMHVYSLQVGRGLAIKKANPIDPADPSGIYIPG